MRGGTLQLWAAVALQRSPFTQQAPGSCGWPYFEAHAYRKAAVRYKARLGSAWLGRPLTLEKPAVPLEPAPRVLLMYPALALPECLVLHYPQRAQHEACSRHSRKRQIASMGTAAGQTASLPKHGRVAHYSALQQTCQSIAEAVANATCLPGLDAVLVGPHGVYASGVGLHIAERQMLAVWRGLF